MLPRRKPPQAGASEGDSSTHRCFSEFVTVGRSSSTGCFPRKGSISARSPPGSKHLLPPKDVDHGLPLACKVFWRGYSQLKVRLRRAARCMRDRSPRPRGWHWTARPGSWAPSKTSPGGRKTNTVGLGLAASSAPRRRLDRLLPRIWTTRNAVHLSKAPNCTPL